MNPQIIGDVVSARPITVMEETTSSKERETVHHQDVISNLEQCSQHLKVKSMKPWGGGSHSGRLEEARSMSPRRTSLKLKQTRKGDAMDEGPTLHVPASTLRYMDMRKKSEEAAAVPPPVPHEQQGTATASTRQPEQHQG